MKKILSLFLTFVIIISISVVSFSAESVDAQKSTTIAFDANSTDWTGYKNIRFHIWDCESNESFFTWGSKREFATNIGNGIWSYDLENKGITLEEGKTYGIMFSSDAGHTTYPLLFDASVIKNLAYCDGNSVESPYGDVAIYDMAFWYNQDAQQLGPELIISEKGELVGSCMNPTTNEYKMFEDYLSYTHLTATFLTGKSDQELIDNLAVELSLSIDDVQNLISASPIYINWNYYDSILSRKDVLTQAYSQQGKNTIAFDALSGDWVDYYGHPADSTSTADKPAYAPYTVYVHIWQDGGDPFFAYMSSKEKAVQNDNHIWTYDLSDKGISLADGKTYYVLFADDRGHMTTELQISKDKFSKTVYCVPRYELAPSDSDKGLVYAYWGNIIGDADLDKTITVMDATEIQLYLAQLKYIGRNNQMSADADKDGTLTVMDATQIQLFLSQIVDTL